MLTDVLTYRPTNQGLTAGGFIQKLTDNTTCVIDFKAVFSGFSASATDFKTVLTLTLCFRTPLGVRRSVENVHKKILPAPRRGARCVKKCRTHP